MRVLGCFVRKAQEPYFLNLTVFGRSSLYCSKQTLSMMKMRKETTGSLKKKSYCASLTRTPRHTTNRDEDSGTPSQAHKALATLLPEKTQREKVVLQNARVSGI